MGVAEGGIGYGYGVLLTQRLGESFRAEFAEFLPGSWQRLHALDVRELGRGVRVDSQFTIGLVDGDVREPGEELGAAVRGNTGLQQFGALINEVGGDVAGDEVGVVSTACRKEMFVETPRMRNSARARRARATAAG